MDKFISLEFLLSFPGMISIVIILTQFTKRMFDKLVNNRTQYVVYAYSFLLCVFAAMLHGKFITPAAILETILVWSINSVIVWAAAMKTFETVSKTKYDGVMEVDSRNTNTEKYNLNWLIDIDDIKNKKEVRLSVDSNAKLSQE